MSIKGKAYVVGAFEHPLRTIRDRSTAQVHAECALAALADAGLNREDVDAYFCAGDAPGFGALSMVDYLGLKPRHIDSTETGGSSYILHVGHAAEAIAAGKCRVALITMAGRPSADTNAPRSIIPSGGGFSEVPEAGYEGIWGITAPSSYGLCAKRHMYEFGTTNEQLAWVKVAASHHAQWNPNAKLRDVVTVEQVLSSPMISDPLHRLDCCVVTDGGGAIILAAPEVARSLSRPKVRLLGHGEATKGPSGGRGIDLTYSAAVFSGPPTWAELGLAAGDIKYASIYDSFTITVIMQLEDLGFCAKGEGGRFVADGKLISGVGKLPINTDGGGLCNNHPSNRGGMTKLVEAVRQLRGEAHPKVQVPNCNLALVHGTGGSLAMRHVGATLILERE